MKKPAQLQEKQKPAYDKSVTSASFSMSGSTIRLTLRGNAPMVGHYFTLKNPERIVLDLAGGWDVSVPPVPSNRLIRSVRTGRHEDKTRLVFDMKTEGRAVLVPIDRNSLELSIR
ncbi:MAG: AMIN domain-containing protein [Mailhella sp.]|nr:AMIN domain-containing protein [Mailhella sp.]